MFVDTERGTLAFADHIWLIVQACTIFVRDGCFLTSHWIFAFEYHLISKIMPYILAGREIPPEKTKYDNKIFNTFLFLNILAPLMKGILFFLFCEYKFYSAEQSSSIKFTTLLNVSDMACYILQIITGLFLGCAICSVQDYFHIHRMRKYINIEVFSFHASTFILYMMSSVVFAVFQAYYLFTVGLHSDLYFWTFAFSNFCSFLSMLCLCYIFWQMAPKNNSLLSQ